MSAAKDPSTAGPTGYAAKFSTGKFVWPLLGKRQRECGGFNVKSNSNTGFPFEKPGASLMMEAVQGAFAALRMTPQFIGNSKGIGKSNGSIDFGER